MSSFPLWDWIWMTLHTRMSDLSFLQWMFVMLCVIGMIWGGMMLGDLGTWMRKGRIRKTNTARQSQSNNRNPYAPFQPPDPE